MGPPTDDLKKALTEKYRQATGKKAAVPVNYYDGFVSVQIIFNLNSNVAQLYIYHFRTRR